MKGDTIMYGSIGCTRRDKTPAHWRKDYRLTQKAKAAIRDIEAEREALFQTLEALPLDTPDEEYTKAERALTAKLDALIDREDAIRQANPR
jgi:DNA-binding PadR family transcriptional regulator